MGGVPTVAVECSAFADAETIDSTITTYIVDGLIVENEEMVYYSWFWFGMYFWHLNMMSYIEKIEAIAQCGIANEVGSENFGEDWMGETFYPTMQLYIDNVWYLTEIWWVTAFIGFFPYFGWVVLIINIIFMLDF